MEIKGFYGVIEGIDASGKTTQQKMLTNSLEKLGFIFPETKIREPGGTVPGEIMRDILVEDDAYKAFRTPKSQVLGFNFARAVLVEKVIKKLLAEGKVVLVDRSWLSTISYQCFAEGMNLEQVMAICEFAMAGCMPNHIFILDISVEEAMKRIAKSPEHTNHYDKKTADFVAKLRDGYQWSAERYKDIVTVINGEQDVDTIAAEILQKTLEVMDELK